MSKYYQQECDRDWPGGGIRLVQQSGEAILIDLREDDERDEYTFQVRYSPYIGFQCRFDN